MGHSIQSLLLFFIHYSLGAPLGPGTALHSGCFVSTELGDGWVRCKHPPDHPQGSIGPVLSRPMLPLPSFFKPQEGLGGTTEKEMLPPPLQEGDASQPLATSN